MRFAIRDDDICYFTQPAQLEAVYANIWQTCPVSLSVVPFHGCTRSGAIPKEYWEGDMVFPIGENRDLVKFLKKRIAEKKVSIVMHGFSHKDEVNGYEFESGANLGEKMRDGKQYLEQLFEVPIKVFVPPHNTLSSKGLSAVIENGLNICSRTWPKKHGGKTLDRFRHAEVRIWEKTKRGRYPHVIRYSRHAEVGYYPLTPIVSLESLAKGLRFQSKHNGVFVLAAHYWEFNETMRFDSGASMHDAFMKIWDQVMAFKNVEYLSLNDVFGT